MDNKTEAEKADRQAYDDRDKKDWIDRLGSLAWWIVAGSLGFAIGWELLK
jgi:hypothetical protein